MLTWQNHRKLRIFIKALCILLIATFLSYDLSWAGATEVLPFRNLSSLPQAPFVPPTLKYLSVNTANPHNYFNFLLDKGKTSSLDINKEARQLINYFFLGITLPDNAFWVNLKPAESDRITSEQLSRTDLGRVLLEQDFRLKRDMSQYLSPQNPVGRQFWEKLYAVLGRDKAKKAGIITSNRVWIVPAEAVVVETEDGALLAKSSLKVLLESEYTALKLKPDTQSPPQQSPFDNSDNFQALTEQLMKEIIIPAIAKDVNESKNYAPLRQIYHSLILAQWFKRKYKNTDSAYAQAINKGNLNGLESQVPWERQQIWQEYLKSYKQGEYKIQDTIFGLKRMYFSGGVLFDLGATSFPLKVISQKELPEALKYDPDLLNPDSLKDGLVVITERKGTQGDSEGQPLVQSINVVSSQENLPKETTTKQIEKENSESQELTIVPEASSPINSNRSDGTSASLVARIKNIIYQFIRRFTKKGIKPAQDISTHLVRTQEQIHIPRQDRITTTPQSGNDISLFSSSRQEIESRIRQLGDSVAQTSKDALIRSFRPTGPAELPLPIPITMLNQDLSDRDKIIHIIENMQRMMDGTDEKVLRDFERAIDNARDRVTEQALEQFETLSNEQIYQLLTQGYFSELQKEFQSIIENQIQHMIHFHAPSVEEQRLYVSEDINERYPRLPRYLKWLLTNNPHLENDPLIKDWLDAIQIRVSQIPSFPEMIQDYSKKALNKSLYLNPELAMRIILYLSMGENLDNVSENQVVARIQQELARNLPEDIDTVDFSVIEEDTLELPPGSEIRALPAPNIEKTDSLKARLKVLMEEYQRFLTKFTEQEGLVRKQELDLAELSEGFEEAERQNDKVIIAALKPAVEGLTSKLRKAKQAFSRLEQEKAKYEEQINQLRKESDETSSSPLSGIEPLSLGVGAVFMVMFGLPLYITKKILDKWYNTTAGKTFGILASLSMGILGYYTYIMNLTPQIQEVFTNFSHADWWQLSTFFITWPIMIISGIFGGKFGKGISHERLYRKANSAFNAGRIDEAITLINAAIKLHPKDNLYYRLLARSYNNKKRFDEAIAAYQKALEFNPNDSISHNNLGVIYDDEKENDTKAIECYRRSVELEPNDPVVLRNLGRTLRTNGQLLEAARVLQKAQQIEPDASITELLSQILHQVGDIPKPQKPPELKYNKTLNESLRIERERGWLSQLDYDDNLGAVAWLGAIVAWIIGGIFLYYVPYGQHWDLGTSENPATLGIMVWVGEIVVAPLLGAGLTVALIWPTQKITDLFKKAYRFIKFPTYYKRLQKVNLLPSDELSDSDLKAVAPIYARMSREYLEKIFRSWVDAGHEEKIVRLFKFGEWKSEKTRLYGDIGEYKRVSRAAATKFATTAQEQKVILDSIDGEKEKLNQKDIANAVALMKDVLPQITEHSRNRDEFWYWLALVVGLPKNILDQGQRQVLTVFTDLREFDRAQEESVNKFGTNQEASVKVKAAINGLIQKLGKEGLNYPGILKKALVEINKASRNLDEFLFWINEVMQFDKQLWSSGGFLGLLQNLIAYVRAKEEASKKLCRNPEETSRLFQAVDNLREDLRRKQVSGDVSMLKDIIPRVTEASQSLQEFFDYIRVLKAFDKNILYGTQSALQAFNNHVAYKQARENAAVKFTQDDASRQKFLSDIDNLRLQLVQKGFPQASDLLKDILPELTKTCRSKEEFIYWLGELVGLNTTVWRSGVQAVINNFNDLAGFKQAKEMAMEKLGTNPQEKDDLARSIDSLKAKLEEKRPSCAGLIKDVILEILKDIDSLASPQYRRTDFVWWLTMCVNFETQTWAAGTKQVLVGYQELKDYVTQRRELTTRFTTNSEEQKRLASVWDILDKTANFTKPASISLLRNTLAKIANFAINPREFVFWVGTLSELNNEVLEVFCRDIDTVLAYYKEKGKSRDFNHLSATLNQYHKTYHQTVLITVNLLDTLTDPSLDINKRIEKVSQFLIEQKIVKLGAPPNLVGLKDSVSFDELIRAAGEDTVRGFIQSYTPIRRAMERMGREGIYSYAEAQRPAYYKHFLEEAKGLIPGFNQPGEKFRVSYLGDIMDWPREQEIQTMPIADNVQALRQLIQYLRMEWPNLYDNFIEPKRELIKGRPLEEFITSETVEKMAQQLLGKVQKWQFSEQQRTAFILKIMEIFAFAETADFRIRINSATDEFNKLRVVAQYWEKVLELILKYKWLQEKSKFYPPISKFIKQRIVTINNKLDIKGKGILQFYLSGGTLADFFKGWVSQDCTRNTDGDYPHFLDTQAFVMDPGCFLFKVIEDNNWISNIYTFLFKDKDGKFYLYLDMFQVKEEHPLVKNGEGQEELKREFSRRFIQEFMNYLGSQGFDYLLISSDPAQRGIKETLQKIAQEKSVQSGTKTFSLKKLGGTEFFSEAGVSEEYVQTISGNYINNSFQDVNGYRIELNKTTAEIIQPKQIELDYIEKLLGEMYAEEARLALLIKEGQEALNQINRKGYEEASAGKNAIAAALMTASEQKKAEIQKIEYELAELRVKMQEKKLEADRLRAGLGMFKSPSAQNPAVASSPISELIMPFLVIAGVTGLFAFLYYLFNKLFPEGPKYEPYRGIYRERKLYEEYKLPQDVEEQLTKVLAKVSPALQNLTPEKINIRVPFEVGIRRAQSIKALRLLFATLLENNSVLDFLKTHPFYQEFKQRANELGLVDNFDQPKHEYFFSIPKEEIRQEEDRRAQDFIEDAIAKLKKKYRGISADAVLQEISNREPYLKKRGFKAKQTEFYEYYLLLKGYAYLRFQDKLDGIPDLLSGHKYLEALSLLEEFLRVGIGAELIALESDIYVRDVLNRILNRELEDVRWQFNRLSGSKARREQTLQASRDIHYSVVLSNRSADDILRGVASGDCTAINGSAFYNTIPQFLFDPGFLNFKILQEDKWVGNVYAIVAEKDNNPVLIIDAIQLPVWGRTWPISVKNLADKVLEQVVEYAQEQGFAQVLMSSFVSNFNAVHEHFNAQYPTQGIEIEKIAGFGHLKALGLWDRYASRNEYLETFSPQWNYGLKQVDPNNPKQTLLLRRIWERSPPSQLSEESPIDLNKSSSPLNQEISSRKPGGLFKFIQHNIRKAVFIISFFIMLALPQVANAAKFQIVPGAQPNQTQVVAIVEKGDNLWNIAGVAYRGVEGIGQGRYAAHAEWPRIFENEVNQQQVLKDRQHKLGPQYPDTKQIVNVRPGDTLVIPGPVNYEAMGLKAPEVTHTQQQMQTQQELKDLQQQRTQAKQELNQLQQQRQAAQADLENLQRQKTELTRQILDLKKQLADIQEQLRQAKEKIPSGLQTEEAKRQALGEELRQLEQKKTKYTQDIANLERQYKEAQDDLDRITAQKEKAGQELEQLRQQSPQAQAQIKDLQNEIQRLEAQKKQQQEELSKLQNQRDELRKGIEQLNQDRGNLEKDLNSLRRQISETQKALEQAKQRVPTTLEWWNNRTWIEQALIIASILCGIGIIIFGIYYIVKRPIKMKLKKAEEELKAKLRELEEVNQKLERAKKETIEKKDVIALQEEADAAQQKRKEEEEKLSVVSAERTQIESEVMALRAEKRQLEKERELLKAMEEKKIALQAEIDKIQQQEQTLREELGRVKRETEAEIERTKQELGTFKAGLSDEENQLLAKREELNKEISALDTQLKEKRVELASLLDKSQQEKDILKDLDTRVRAQRDELESLDDKVKKLQQRKTTLDIDIGELIAKKKKLSEIELPALEEKRTALKEEVERLEIETQKPKKAIEEAEEIIRGIVEPIPPIEDRRWGQLCRGVNSRYFNVLELVARLRQYLFADSRTGDEDLIRDTLANDIIHIFGEDNVAIYKQQEGYKNLVCVIPAYGGQQYEELNPIILNAHMDSYLAKFEQLNMEEKAIYHQEVDDDVGLAVIVETLRVLKDKPHRKIVVIFDASEELGALGMDELLGRKLQSIPNDIKKAITKAELAFTIDGPIDWERIAPIIGFPIPEEDIKAYEVNPNTPYVVVYPNPNMIDQKTPGLRRLLSATIPSSSQYKIREAFGSAGSEKKLASYLKIPVVNFRAGHTGYHVGEKFTREMNITVDNLVALADWFTEIIINLSFNTTTQYTSNSVGNAKGQGMFAPEEHAEVNEVISTAQREGRGLLIWGDAGGWKQAKDGYVQDISDVITGLRRYPRINIQGLGTIDIPEILAVSNIVLIQPRNHSPPGLVVKSKNSYQIAHSGEAFNSIYIDEKIYKQLYSFEIAVLLAHEAIELGAKQIARRKRIPWTVELAKQVHRLAEEYEIKIVGKSPNGRGSRFDDRIEALLDFANLNKKVQIPPMPREINPEPKKKQDEKTFIPPEPQKKQDASKDINPLTLKYMEANPGILDSLRKLFLESLSKDLSANLPAKLDNFPPPLAQEIRQAYQLGKVKGMPLDADFLAALVFFFSKIFPNHANELIQYMRNLRIYLIDNTRSTYGATLSGDTFYIQKSCIEDLLGRPITVEEIYQGIKNKDPRICVALFRILIHELGSGFFKLSHPANQELEEVFLAILSKTEPKISPSTQQEINNINKTPNLDSLARIDWAQKRTRRLDIDYSKLNLDDLLETQPLAKPNINDEPGGIDLTKIEITLKDEKFISSLNPADLKILRAARALKEGQNGLAVLYIHEVRLMLKDNILSERDITQGALFRNLLSQLGSKDLLQPEVMVEFYPWR